MPDAHAHGRKVVLPGGFAHGHHAVGVGIANKQRVVYIFFARVFCFRKDDAVKFGTDDFVGVLVIPRLGRVHQAGSRAGQPGRLLPAQKGKNQNSQQHGHHKHRCNQNGNIDKAAFFQACHISGPFLFQQRKNMLQLFQGSSSGRNSVMSILHHSPTKRNRKFTLSAIRRFSRRQISGLCTENLHHANIFARCSAGRSAAASNVATTSATAAFTQDAESFATSRTCTAPMACPSIQYISTNDFAMYSTI